MNTLTAAALLTLSTPFLCRAAEKPEPGKQSAQSAEVTGDNAAKTTLHYWLALPPADEAKPADGWPLMVFLHGSGERGADLNMVKKHGPAKLAGTMPELNKFIIVSPQCPNGRWWDVEALKGLIDHVAATQPVDKNRIILTGLSMGGFATWGLLAKYPDLPAAAVPVCGGGDPTTAAKFKNVPIRVYHGAKDTVVLPQRSEEMVEALKKAGGTPEYKVYPDAAHDSWTDTYSDPKLYEWMLAQKKAK